MARQKIAPEAADANQHWHHDATAADAAGSAERRGEEGERKNDVVVGFQRQQVLFHHLLPALNFLLSSIKTPPGRPIVGNVKNSFFGLVQAEK